LPLPLLRQQERMLALALLLVLAKERVLDKVDSLEVVDRLLARVDRDTDRDKADSLLEAELRQQELDKADILAAELHQQELDKAGSLEVVDRLLAREDKQEPGQPQGREPEIAQPGAF
jgi:hypothetical protein